MALTSNASYPDQREQQPSLKDYFDVLRRRKRTLLQVFVLVFGVGIVTTLLTKPVYETRVKLSVIPPPATLNMQDPKDPLSAVYVQAQPESVATTMQLLQGEQFQKEAWKGADVKIRPGVVPPSVRVESIANSTVISVTVRGGDPREIQRLANTILDRHLNRVRDFTEASLKKAVTHVKREFAKASDTLKLTKAELREFRRKTRFSTRKIDEEAKAEQYKQLAARVATARSNAVTAAAQVSEVKALLAAEPLTIKQEGSASNPLIPKLRERQSELRLQLVELQEQYTDQSAVLQSAKKRLASVDEQLTKEPSEIVTVSRLPNPARPLLQTRLAQLRADLQGFLADYRESQIVFQRAQLGSDQMSALEDRLDSLTRENELALANYMSLAEKLRDLEIRSSIEIPTARQLERASLPTSPVLPRIPVSIMVSGILALLIGIGAALLQDFLDDRIHSPEDVERLTALPSLGHVPFTDHGNNFADGSLPTRSHIMEAYRVLRSSVGFAGVDAPLRHLQVTSALQGEGKTTTAVNLAIAMAQEGKRVILLDADLRRPRIHRMMKVPGAPGLSDVLVGSRTLDEALCSTAFENLQILPSGPVPPNPAELLGSAAFSRLIDELDDRADVIIYDTPPCIPVTDATVVAARMDGVVLIVRMERSQRGALKAALSALRQAHARVLGVVNNGMREASGSYYYYYYQQHGYYEEDEPGQNGARSNGRRRTAPLGSGRNTPVGGPREDEES